MCETIPLKRAKPWKEPWEANGTTLYHGQPHSPTWEIATFASKNTADGGDNEARCKLAAQSPEMADILIRLLKGAKRRKVMGDIARVLEDAGVLV